MQLTDTSALNPPIASSHGEIAFPENGFASENVLHFLHLDLAFSTNCFTPDKLSTIFFTSPEGTKMSVPLMSYNVYLSHA